MIKKKSIPFISTKDDDIAFILLLSTMFFRFIPDDILNLIKIITYIYIIIIYFKNNIVTHKLRVKEFIYILFFVFILVFGYFYSPNFNKLFNLIAQAICFYIIVTYWEINPSLIKLIFITLACLSTVFMYLTNPNYNNRFYLDQFIDPNYTGHYLFLLAYFSKACGYNKLFLIILFLSFFTYSRNVYIAFVLYIFLSFNIVEKFIKRILNKKIFNYFTLSVLSILLTIIISYVYINIYESNNYTINTNYITSIRDYNMMDGSNYMRFIYNKIFIEDFISNPIKYIYGISENLLHKTVPFTHNSYFLNIIKYGLFYIPIFITICYPIKKDILLNKISLIIPLFTYYCFLGLGLSGMELILTAFCLKINKEKFKNNKLLT